MACQGVLLLRTAPRHRIPLHSKHNPSRVFYPKQPLSCCELQGFQLGTPQLLYAVAQQNQGSRPSTILHRSPSPGGLSRCPKMLQVLRKGQRVLEMSPREVHSLLDPGRLFSQSKPTTTLPQPDEPPNHGLRQLHRCFPWLLALVALCFHKLDPSFPKAGATSPPAPCLALPSQDRHLVPQGSSTSPPPFPPPPSHQETQFSSKEQVRARHRCSKHPALASTMPRGHARSRGRAGPSNISQLSIPLTFSPPVSQKSPEFSLQSLLNTITKNQTPVKQKQRNIYQKIRDHDLLDKRKTVTALKAGEDRAILLGLAMMVCSIMMYFLLGITLLRSYMQSVWTEEAQCSLLNASITESFNCSFSCGPDCWKISQYPCLQVYVNLTSSGQKLLLYHNEETMKINSECSYIPKCGKNYEESMSLVNVVMENFRKYQRFSCFYDPEGSQKNVILTKLYSSNVLFHSLFWPTCMMIGGVAIVAMHLRYLQKL
ncbi:Calcium-activated potassium channel subunit beta-2 isoform X4 [Aix galericulata]|nr:Calcium-activated potassium channel subunit beta-2 isoform X4 [Aix galericulata]